MRTLKAANGEIDVSLDSYYTYCTYGGCFTGGLPDPRGCVMNAQNVLKSLWGPDRHVLVVPPVFTGTKIDPRLGERCMMAWLFSKTPPASDPSDDGSHLFVVWFNDRDPIDPLATALAQVEKHGGWWQHARGFVS